MDRPKRRTKPPLLTGAACALSVAIFLMMQGVTDWSSASRWGYYPESALYEGRWWALLTHAFVHRHPFHILFNLVWFWHLGGALEKSFGPLRWLSFVLGAAFVSSGIAVLGEGWGIGLSGVVYALCGFGWQVRGRYPEFARVVTYDTLKLFIGWGILCVFLTYANILNVGNLAHLSGFVFGAVAGVTVERPKWRVPASIGLAAMAGLAITPIFWNPRSEVWTVHRAIDAHRRQDWVEATRLYRRALALGVDPQWVWINLAEIYGDQEDATNYRQALQELYRLAPEEANRIRKEFGAPKD